MNIQFLLPSVCSIWGCQCCFCRPVGGPLCQNSCRKRQKKNMSFTVNRKKKKKSRQKTVQNKRDGCLSNLFNSNLLAFCLSRFMIHNTRERPDNDRAPPAATPDVMAVTGDGKAVEVMLIIESFWEKKYLNLMLYLKLFEQLILFTNSTLAGGFFSSPVAMTITRQQLMSL